jgi:hypothetical protein
MKGAQGSVAWWPSFLVLHVFGLDYRDGVPVGPAYVQFLSDDVMPQLRVEFKALCRDYHGKQAKR